MWKGNWKAFYEGLVRNSILLTNCNLVPTIWWDAEMNQKYFFKISGLIILTSITLVTFIVPANSEPFETYNVSIADFKVNDGITFVVEGYQVQFAVTVNSSSRYEYYSTQNNNLTEVNTWAKEPGPYLIALTYGVAGPTNLTIYHRSRQADGTVQFGVDNIQIASIQRVGVNSTLEYKAIVAFEAVGEADSTDTDPAMIVERTVGLLSLLPVHQYVLLIFFLIPFPMGVIAYKWTVPEKIERDLPYENVKYRLYSTYLRILFFLNLTTPIFLMMQDKFTNEFLVGFLIFQAIVIIASILIRREARNIDLDHEERMLMKGHPPPDDKDIELGKSTEEERRRLEET